MNEKSSIGIKKDTKARLAHFGLFQESFEEVIIRLMDHAEKTNFDCIGSRLKDVGLDVEYHPRSEK